MKLILCICKGVSLSLEILRKYTDIWGKGLLYNTSTHKWFKTQIGVYTHVCREK